MARSCLSLLLLLTMTGRSSSSNILFLSPHTSYSHTNFFLPVIKELAARGHSVTYWNGLKPREEIDNVQQMYSEELHHFNTNHKIGFGSNNPYMLMLSLPERMTQVCNAVYNDVNFGRLLKMKNTTQFDVILIEGFMNECMLPLVDYFKAPFIYLTALPPLPYMLEMTDNPLSSDHFPCLPSGYTDEMSLLERIGNTIMGLGFIHFRHWFVLSTVDRVSSQSSVTLTQRPVREIESNVSLLITNAQFGINYQYPKTAAILEAGGLHFTPSSPLPEDVQDFIKESGDAGFIVLSFGSILKGANLPPATRDIFARVFARIPQRVLWKYEDERGIPNLSANVRLFRWLPPYMDLLAHPKIRLIMTHGGLFSNQEAVYNEVPLIGFPVFGDQGHYTLKAQKDGYARYIDWKTVTEESLYEAVTDVINNPKYKERVQHVSRVMKDQMDKPLDRAVYWIEYVIRYQGAPHLRTSARHLSLYQRGLFDVVLVVTCTLLILFCASVCLLLRVVSARKTVKPKQQ